MNVPFGSALALTLVLGIQTGVDAAAPTSSGDSTIDAHAEVAAVLYAASATQAALAKSVDARLRSQQERINALAAELKAGNTSHRAEVTATQEAFVAELTSKDREYAAQIGLFRSTVSDIASTPEGTIALERFNAGDEVGALAILDRLRATNERVVWQSRTLGRCPGLREHIARFPDGVYRIEAADLLTARRISTLETWQPATRTLALFEPPRRSPAKDEAAAQARALELAKSDTDRLCRGFGAGTLYRFLSSTPIAEHWSCTKDGSRTVCGCRGHAECKLSARLQTEQERCG